MRRNSLTISFSMKIPLCFLMCSWFHLTCSSQQYYDQTSCSSDLNFNPGTRYICSSSSRNQCRTFLVFRANSHFSTISNISTLFRTESNTLLSINENVLSSTQILPPGHEVLVPVECSCSGRFYHANFTYIVTQNARISTIACDFFQGLVKSITLAEENLVHNNVRVINAGFLLRVPLKCACPDQVGFKYLVTYPLIKGDNTEKLSEKFNVSVEEIWRANHMDPTPTVFPDTTVLVPLRNEPVVNFSVPDSDPPTGPFLPTKKVEKRQGISLFQKNVYIAGSVLGFSLIVALFVTCGLYIKIKFKSENNISSIRVSSLNSCSTPWSANSCLSPDLLVGIKYNLSNYTVEELRQSTNNFSEEAKISRSMYRGLVDNGEVIVKQMSFEKTKQVIDFHSKINHVNIVKLHGVGYGEEESSYLVFDYPSNGSLRDCLACSNSALHWHRRTQIAFDIATGLHYLHYSVSPVCSHLSLSCKNIFLSSNWRAKITVFGTRRESDGVGGEKVDIYAFGMVILELISGREVGDGECVRFLGGGDNEVGCFDELRGFVDHSLKGDYPIHEALCLAVLGASCVDDDPMHRPSMDDVLKVLARMV